ncbi:hypothetical protein ACUN9Y_18900 [Halomonas sp. V046]
MLSYAETNVLVALASHGADTGTPSSKASSKAGQVRLEKSARIV